MQINLRQEAKIIMIKHCLISRGLFPEEQKECCKWTRGTEELLYIDQHILSESKTRQKKLAMPWLTMKRHIIWSTKLDNKWSQNVQNNRRSHKLYRENHGNLESGIDTREKKFSCGKDPEKYIRRRCTITITICYSNYATQPHTQEMHRWIQTW